MPAGQGPILVTGGAGFIGSHVVAALEAAGHDTRVLDLAAPDGAGRGDVRDPDDVAKAVDGVSAVCHQAARVGLETAAADVVDYVSHNDLGTAVLLRGLDQAGFRGRLVLAASMVVYGEGVYRCPEHGRVRPGPRRPADLADRRFDPPCPACGAPLVPDVVTEADTVDPRNVYAATKLHQEHLCSVFGRTREVPVALLRYHNVYGPGMPRDTPYAGVAAIFSSELRAGRPPRVFEDGGQRRDFVHVRDVARANVLALTAEPAPTGPFNIASGEPHTVGDMAAALADAFGPAAPRPVVTGAWRLGDVRHIVASPARARAELGFTAEISFAAGMAEFARA